MSPSIEIESFHFLFCFQVFYFNIVETNLVADNILDSFLLCNNVTNSTTTTINVIPTITNKIVVVVTGVTDKSYGLMIIVSDQSDAGNL